MKKPTQRASGYRIGFLHSVHPFEKSISPTQHKAGGY